MLSYVRERGLVSMVLTVTAEEDVEGEIVEVIRTILGTTRQPKGEATL